MGCGGSQPALVVEPENVALSISLPKVDPPASATPANERLLSPGEGRHSLGQSSPTRRQGLSAKPIEEISKKKKKGRRMSEDKPQPPPFVVAKRLNIKASVANNEIFKDLDDAAMNDVCDAIFEMPCEVGKVIFKQGEVGDTFFIVQSGEYQAYQTQLVGEANQVTHRAGDSFGDVALTFGSPRTINVRCVTAGALWALSAQKFHEKMMGTALSSLDTAAKFLSTTETLFPLTDEQHLAIASVVETLKFEAGDVIVRQGQLCDALYFVQRGEVLCRGEVPSNNTKKKQDRRGSEKVVNTRKIGVSGSFGEQSLLHSVNNMETVIASTNVRLLCLRSEKFADLVGDMKEAITRSYTLKVLNSLELFQALTPPQCAILLKSLKDVVFNRGDEIVVQEGMAERFFILKEGVVKVTQKATTDGPPVLICTQSIINGKGTPYYFGEDGLSTGGYHDSTVTATSETVVCLFLERTEFQSMLANAAAEFLALETSQRERQMKKKGKTTMKLEDLIMVRPLGRGQYGSVYLVTDSKTGEGYALKKMNKAIIIKGDHAQHVQNERKLLSEVSHPLLLGLEATFQDAKSVYMLMELARGGELFVRLHESDLDYLDEGSAKFYAACAVSALSHLHSSMIVYRDLKPENLVFDDDGYLCLVDFGFAKKIMDGRTWTVCGTPEYTPPEILSSKGHGFSADWWSLGVLVWEMLDGNTPFSDDDEDHMKIVKNVFTNNPVMPSHFSPEAADFISKLLVSNPAGRLGHGSLMTGRGAHEIRSHPFLSGISFQALAMKQLPTPFMPEVPDLADQTRRAKEAGRMIEEEEVDEDQLALIVELEREQVGANMDALFIDF